MADHSDFFDFLGGFDYEPQNVTRMNLRWQHIIKPILPGIAGVTVLDLGSHDGRWPYAFAGAGAKSVYGIEGRSDLIANFDIVGCLGVYYHTMHHYLMMLQMTAFKPKIIVIDSEFSTWGSPVIMMSREGRC